MLQNSTSWDLRSLVEEKIHKKGGWVNAHAHFDKAYTIQKKDLPFVNLSLQKKWFYIDEMKRTMSVQDIYDRMALATDRMLSQGVQAVGTFIDVDDVIKDKSIQAGMKLRETYNDQITIVFINQVLRGVIQKEARKWFDIGAQFVDIIGGLPAKDAGREGEHLDILLQTAKRLGKMVHVHVDQLNMTQEKETELLIDKTIEHHMEGNVVGIHGISIGTHLKKYREKLYKKMLTAQLMMVSCPVAWIDDVYHTEELTPTHNSITPVDEMVPRGIPVAIGTDNISDIYKPFADGSMWSELVLLLDACRYRNIDKLIEIATTNGLQTLGLEKKTPRSHGKKETLKKRAVLAY